MSSSTTAPRITLTCYRGEADLPIVAALIEKELSEPYIVYTYRYFLNGWPELCYLAWAHVARSSLPLDHPARNSSSKGKQRQPSSAEAPAAATSQSPTRPRSSSISSSSSSSSAASSILSASSGLAAHEEEEGEDDEVALPIGVVVSKLEPHRGQQLRGYIAMLSVAPEWRGRRVATRLVQATLRALHHSGAAEVVLETEADNTASLALYSSLGFLREKRLFRFYLNGKDCFRLVLPIAEPLMPPQQQTPAGIE